MSTATTRLFLLTAALTFFAAAASTRSTASAAKMPAFQHLGFGHLRGTRESSRESQEPPESLRKRPASQRRRPDFVRGSLRRMPRRRRRRSPKRPQPARLRSPRRHSRHTVLGPHQRSSPQKNASLVKTPRAPTLASGEIPQIPRSIQKVGFSDCASRNPSEVWVARSRRPCSDALQGVIRPLSAPRLWGPTFAFRTWVFPRHAIMRRVG